MNTYLFYDLETSGLNRAFNQILQFAAIRTNTELHELERYDIRVKLRADIIPSPAAMIINRISLQESYQGTCEYEAVTEIHRIFNSPGTVSVGYNNLGFDDEFLRFSFYRNLLSPYTHQYAKGCRRMDVLPMAVLYYLYKPDILTWPGRNGKPVLRLEEIGKSNNLASGPFHNAMVDTEVTVNLARVLYQERETWDYISGFFFKETDQQRMEKLPVAFETEWGPHRTGIMTGAIFGPENGYQVPVLFLGKSVPYSNQTLWLRMDSENLHELTSETLADNTWVIRKRPGEPNLILPPLERFTKRMNPERMQKATDNTRWLKQNASLFSEIIRYHKEYEYPPVIDIDADAALYQVGFLSRKDQENCSFFHQADMKGKIKRIPSFSKAEIRTLARRLIWRNYSGDVGPEIEKDRQAYYMRINPEKEEHCYKDFRGDFRRTAMRALLEIKKIRDEGRIDPQQIKILEELKNELSQKFPT